MKLNWFSPLPPVKTDIGNYTLRILSALQNYAEITLWTDQSSWNIEANVRQYHPENIPWADLNRADLNIYNIGNNADFHSHIWQISLQCPGLVILHDFKLHHFFYNVYYRQNKREDYLEQMNWLYGDRGKKDAQKMWEGNLSIDYMAEKYPLTSLALKNALGVVTHTKNADSLQQEQNCPVSYIPLPYKVNPTAKTSLSLAPPYQLIVFGFIDINRRLEVFLKALASFNQKERFHLNIYGQLWDHTYLCQQIQKLALDDLVTIHGFVEEAELDAALSNAHLAINLRYPTVGEASGSQLRIWSHALPSLVTQIGWYAEAEDTVAFVRPEHEIEDIHQHLHNFIASPKQFLEMGKKGRQLLEEQHSPENYAQVFTNFAHQAQKFATGLTAYKLVERVGETISPWTDLQISEEVKRIAESIYFICSSE